MITDTFDDSSEAVITPEKVYGKHEKVCDICIVTFSYRTVENVLKSFTCEQTASIYSVNGSTPIYLLEYKGLKIAFYMTMIGSACAGTCIEEASCLTGATKFIMYGSAGCLNKEIAAGKVMVPTAAYRDEGFSYHYAPASDYIPVRNAGKVASFLEASGIPYVMGKTWTTDGVYRETRRNMEKRRAEGCVSVEMECAGAQAVCDFRGLEYYDFLISGDLLDSEEWDRRILGTADERSHQLKNFYIALELALTI
jgi:uridine phosphorylase